MLTFSLLSSVQYLHLCTENYSTEPTKGNICARCRTLWSSHVIRCRRSWSLVVQVMCSLTAGTKPLLEPMVTYHKRGALAKADANRQFNSLLAWYIDKYRFFKCRYIDGTGTENSMSMMTLSNGNIFCVTGPLWGGSTGHRWIPLTKASDAELGSFLWSVPEQKIDETIKTPVIWHTISLIMT